MSIENTDPLRRPGTVSENDLPPTGATAEARRRESVAPILWLVFAMAAVAIFIVALLWIHGMSPPASIGK